MQFSTHGALMDPIGEESRADRDDHDEDARRDRNRRDDGKAGPLRGREPSEARRAAIGHFCDRLARDFDETVLAIESILRKRSRVPTRGGENPLE
jgi:hypothetical protein